MSTVRVAAVQFATGSDPDENLSTCVRLVDEAAALGAQLVVLPEFCNHIAWYDDRAHARRMAVTPDGPFVSAIAAAARRHGIWVKLNCTMDAGGGRITGTNLLLDPYGAVVGACDKQVLMGAENDYLDPGEDPGTVVETPFGPVGLYACMEGVVPEPPRALALRGARMLLNSLNSFALDEASLHIPVRAAENKVFVVAANKVGPLIPREHIDRVATATGVPAEHLCGAGESQIVAPDGSVLAKGPRTGEAVVVADVDPDLAGDKRRPDGTDLFAVRRPDVYAPLAASGPAPAGGAAAEVAVAALQPAGPAAAADAVARAAADGAVLVVLPELFTEPGGVADEPGAAARRGEQGIAALREALAGSDAVVVASVVGPGGSHDGVVVGGGGVLHRQPQLHRCARHPWVARLGDAIEVLSLPWGTLAVVVGDDVLQPESCRLAALAGAQVVAVPCTVQERWETELGLLERSAENRVSIVASCRPGPAGTSVVVTLPPDLTLWTARTRPFDGTINLPDVSRAAPGDPGVRATVYPGRSANRMISRGTDLLDGRPRPAAGVLARSEPAR